MRPMFSVSSELISSDARLTHAAKPYFARMAAKSIGKLEEKYPKTVSLLFEAALNYIKNPHNDSLAENMSIPSIIDLLQQEAKQLKNEHCEIIDDNVLKPQIPKSDLNGLSQLFHDYVVNLQIPSYRTVELLIERNKLDLACETALKLMHDYDKAKSINMLILYYLHHKKTKKAMDLFNYYPENANTRDLVSKTLDALMAEHQFDQALAFSKSLKDKELCEYGIHELSLRLIKSGKFEEGVRLLNEITDCDIKAYTLSLVVTILTSQKKFTQASNLALTIQDKDYQRDALNDIVKKMVRMISLKSAEEFVAHMEGVVEKKEASKIIESSLKARLQDERIKKLQLKMTSA